jgi:hypothetical protein
VKYSNDDHSFREKFCLVIWIGEEVKVMRRAKVSREGTIYCYDTSRGQEGFFLADKGQW